MWYFHSDFVTLGTPYARTISSETVAMKPTSAAKKKLLLGDYFSSLRDKEEQRRYMEMVSVISGFDPYESERNEWQDDVDLWPSITYIHLGMSLLVNPSPYTGEDLMNYEL